MGIFIEVSVANQTLVPPELGHKIAASCPVEIFVSDGAVIGINPEREDECTLCELCLDLAPAGAVIIRKTYKEECLISRGESSSRDHERPSQ